MINVRDDQIRVIKKIGDVFGDTQLLNEEKLTRSFLYTKSPVKCLVIQPEKLH